MTELRKKIQNKLRRKYGYSTSTNYDRGMILVKPYNKEYDKRVEKTNYLNIVYDYYNVTPEYGEIELHYGDRYICGFTFEEFELVYQALKQYHDYEKYEAKGEEK